MNPQIIRVIVHMQGSACLDTAGDAIARSRTTNVPMALCHLLTPKGFKMAATTVVLFMVLTNLPQVSKLWALGPF